MNEYYPAHICLLSSTSYTCIIFSSRLNSFCNPFISSIFIDINLSILAFLALKPSLEQVTSLMEPQANSLALGNTYWTQVDCHAFISHQISYIWGMTEYPASFSSGIYHSSPWYSPSLSFCMFMTLSLTNFLKLLRGFLFFFTMCAAPICWFYFLS